MKNDEIEDNFYRFENRKERKNKNNKIDWNIEKIDKEDEDLSDTIHEFGFDNIEKPQISYVPEYYT